MYVDRTVSAMDLADFLAEKLKKSSYRELEDEIKVSRGSLENIVKRQNIDFPKIETLTRISIYYKKPLWEVMLMANVNLGLPQDTPDRLRRLAQLIEQHPNLEGALQRAYDKIGVDPGYVDGVIMGIEAAFGPPPSHPQ